ncbi:hypothetical protein BDN71DRAFT_1410425 [Pleurotus eryngii]|uniref:Ino eighty subunit 1 n=1 Tax=Pleurotus eryngii TaxID=5323 RepID=A0A9P6A4N6_PLEER|nr:hypothetical protein BDN71DRAFT_1410425 [Pleurotus eryngii]
MASAQTGSSSQVLPSPWPADTMAPVGYLSRKALPIKRADAEPLTREDVQYDLLHHIFSNPKAVFTSATSGKTKKVTFSELYVSALSNSNKCSKVLKDKMKETPAFALELAKISLLTNVGRINTTMAFFPEMKTALRTYHPVPSLQKTDGNAQDAPRIKNCLKAALLPSEIRNMPPSTPEEILNKLRAGQKPPTSVVNLVFVLATHSAPLASVHFDGSFNFLDLFLPRNLSSSDRARTFLWLIYYYLEDPDPPNPFDDDYSRGNPDKAPLPRVLCEEEMNEENIDSPEEIAWGNMMSTQRNAFLQKLVSTMEHDKKVRSSAPHFVPEPEAETSVVTRRSRTRHGLETPKDEASFMYYVPSRESAPPGLLQKDPSPKLLPRGPREDRSMLQHAWHIMKNADPLVDSDEEFADEHTRTDYTRRLDVLATVQRTLSSPGTRQAPSQQRTAMT